MTMPAIGDRIVVNILLGGGVEKPCLVQVMGMIPLGLRIMMIDAADEAGLPAGDQTFVGWDRVAE